MTREREEEIKYEASFYQLTNSREKFIEGAKWADEHPRKGLWDSEKVIMWLRANIDNYANYNVRTDECFVDDFEEELIKAMEE